ncbi:MAG: glycosyltransferase family 2 protein [Ferruginibacter sp.]
MDISVVIITKNEAHIIGKTLQSLQAVAHDIVIVDSGSTDETVAIGKQYNATVIETGWSGYGINKNKGIQASKYDWILSLDADEAIDETLAESLKQLRPANEEEVFDIRFKNFFCNKWIRFGEWGFDRHIRLFNRKKVQWNNSAVHEELIFPAGFTKKRLKGNILHYTVHDKKEYAVKMNNYAMMNAEKYFKARKRSNFGKAYFSPVFSFLQHYIFRLGFLDGPEGLLIARTTARYTFLKYHYLNEMNKNNNTAITKET